MCLTNESFLKNHGGLAKNNFTEIIRNTVNDEEEIDSDFLQNLGTSYYSIENLDKVLSDNRTNFSVLSLNCQSINAKIDKILILIDCIKKHNFEFDAICLQESWLKSDSDVSLIQIPNYKCISQGKHCSQQGGLLTSLHSKYENYSITSCEKSDIWEGLFIKVSIPENG